MTSSISHRRHRLDLKSFMMHTDAPLILAARHVIKIDWSDSQRLYVISRRRVHKAESRNGQ